VRTSHETRGRFDYGRYASNAQRVFRRKTAPGPKRMPRITVLHDISGSMGPANDPSQSQYHALRATMMLQRACELARTPFRLIAFDGSSSDLTHDTRDPERIRARIGELRSRGGTRLAPALRLALEAPTPRDERHAVIIYCDGHIVGPDATTCQALARAHPEVFILPVLIGPDVLDVEFDTAFGRSMLVPDSNDLPTVLRTWIATNLQGHGR
jgi:Mg-chelatase subunit ChlD